MRRGRGARAAGWRPGGSIALAVLIALPAGPLLAQSRLWRPGERALVTDLSYVTAVAATRQVVYAATPNGLAVYDQAFGAWRETVGVLDGFPANAPVTAMAADPSDDTAWLGGRGVWMAWQPFGRRLDTGPLPGVVDQVVLDARDPSAGAYFHTGAGWYFVARGGLGAASAAPPRGATLGSLTAAQLRERLPAFDAVRARLETDEQMRAYRVTSAALVPVTNEVYVGTDGNGVFKVDPVGYGTTRLPAGLAGVAATALAVERGQICAGTSRRIRAERRGVTCFDEDLRDLTVYEGQRSALLPGNGIRDVLVTADAVWAATDAGLVRADRRRGRLEVVGTDDDLPSNDVLALAPAAEGVWAGTARGLSLVADTGRGRLAARTVSGQAVLALAPGGDTLWAGTAAGMSVLLPLAAGLAAVSGPGPLREPVVGLARRGGVLVAVTASRLLVRESGTWRVVDQPGPSIGRLTCVSPDADGFWVGGTQGFAFYDPASPAWRVLRQDDLPVPVYDVVASRGYVWVATGAGVVRFERQVLVR